MPTPGIERREALVVAALWPIILAGAALAPAAPLEPNKWFTSKEHPKTALMVAQRGHVAYTIDVSPDGTALRCEPQSKTELDLRVCELVMERARFAPATDEQGRPAFGLYEGVASFLMPGNSRRPDRAKLAFPIDRLPGDVASPAYAKVAFIVDSAGAISHCASMAEERRRSFHTIEALGPDACARLTKDYRPAPARNAAGDPVTSVQSIVVRFERQP